MPRIGEGHAQPENTGNVQRGRQQRAERGQTARSGSQAPTTSEDVQQIRANRARLMEAARNAPDVRADRVAQARARVQEGYYDRPEVRSTVADRLLQSFEGKAE